MRFRYFRYIQLLLVLMAAHHAVSQQYRFKQYGIDEGIAQPYVYSISQDNNGYLWIGTGEGLTSFDGLDFLTYTTKDSLADNFISSSFTDNKGHIWLGHNNGGISYFDGKSFAKVKIDNVVTSTVNGFTQEDNGQIWAVAQTGSLIKVNKHQLTAETFSKPFKNLLLYSIGAGPAGTLLIGSSEGLLLLQPDQLPYSSKRPETISSIPETKIQAILQNPSNKNRYWIGTSYEGLFELEIGPDGKNRSRKWVDEPGLVNANIQHLFEDGENNLWISTFGKGVFRIRHTKTKTRLTKSINYNKANGLSNNYVKLVFRDKEGNIWIGTYGSGLSMLISQAFEFYKYEIWDQNNDIKAILFTDQEKWFGTGNGLMKVPAGSENNPVYYNSESGFVSDVVTCIAKGGGNTIWIGTESSGLYLMDKDKEKFTSMKFSNDRLANSINAITTDGYLLWVATKGGAFAINPKNGNTYPYTTEKDLPHNNINQIYIDQKQNVWFATQSNRLTCLPVDKAEMIVYEILDSDVPIIVNSITSDMQGNIWIATLGSGIYRLKGNKFEHFSKEAGIGSEYCYSIVADSSNKIWVGHRWGLSRFNINTETFEVFGKQQGITSEFNLNAAQIDKQHVIWFGTRKGVISYNFRKDIGNKIPPAINIHHVQIGDMAFMPGLEINLPYHVYKVRFDFIGISFRDPEKVNYRYLLDGHDLQWSDLSTGRTALYPRLEDGEYTFKVQACNSDGICNKEARQLKLTIAPPLWKQWWFRLLILGIVAVVIVAVIKVREKSLKAVQQRLETELADRTREVVIQKEELAEKNKDITDSITYAKRIQQAILPDKSLLSDLFPESFIFFLPRDIVSGDFYWFKQINNKFYIACIDCTGHGVPGAFMSMIGSTLMKDISTQKHIDTPGKFLSKLDEEIRITLQQERVESSYDGMDLSLCEFDRKSGMLRFSGAMRPIVTIESGEFNIHKTSMFSIGGYQKQEKVFETFELQLKENDLVYMFSDGYPDQFGGPNSKKIKMSGMKNIIKEIWKEDMDDQYLAFKSNFEKWKRQTPQTDDVLIIGLKWTM